MIKNTILIVIILCIVYILYIYYKLYNTIIINTFNKNYTNNNTNTNYTINDNNIKEFINNINNIFLLNQKDISTTLNTTYNINKQLFNKIIEPVTYYKNMKCKNIRTDICNKVGEYFSINKNIIDIISDFINDLHNTSLIIDDIQDNSHLRRSNYSAHIVFGIPISIGAANLNTFNILLKINNISMKFLDFKLLKKKPDYSKLNNTIIYNLIQHKLLNKFIENIYLLNLGQQLDVFWKNTKKIPSIDEYLYMIKNKTGILFIQILDYFYIITNSINNNSYNIFYDILINLSLFFQIRDDYINITDKTYWKTKGFCEDFDEKKYSYIIVSYLNNNNISKKEKKKFLKLFYKPNLSKKEKKKLIYKLYISKELDNTYFKLIQLKQHVNSVINFNSVFNKLPFTKFVLERK